MKIMVKWSDVKDGMLVRNDVGDYLAKMAGRGTCVRAANARPSATCPHLPEHSWPWDDDPECDEVEIIAEMGKKLLDVDAVKGAIG